MLTQMPEFSFNNVDQVDDLFTVYTSDQIKSKLDSRGNELRNALNGLIVALAEADGATNVGATAPAGLTGTTVQELINSLNSVLQNNYYTKTDLQSTNVGLSGGDKIKVPALNPSSGDTVASQLSYLLSQIGSASTGAIPDNSIGLIKLASDVTSKLNALNATIDGSGNITNLNTTAKKIVDAINEVFNSFSTHTNTTNGSAHKGKNILIEDISGHFTSNPKNIENVAAELFTFANNGKTAVANAITAKGVSASPSDTFSVLATKIGQINTGKKFASGIKSITDAGLVYSGENAYYYADIVVNLNFVPKLVIAFWNGSRDRRAMYIDSGFNIANLAGFDSAWIDSSFYSSANNTYLINGTWIIPPTQNLIRIPFYKSGNLLSSITWFAYEL